MVIMVKKEIEKEKESRIAGKITKLKNWFLKSSWKMKVLILLVILGIGFLVNTMIGKSQDGKVTYQTSKVEKGTLITSVSATGSVTTSNIQEVTTQATGVVKKMYVEDGQEVVKGQTIAEIELDLVGEQRNASAYASYLNAVKGVNSANNSVRSARASLDVVYDQIKGHDNDETLSMKETRTKAEVSYDNAYDGLKTAQASLVSAQFSYNQTSPIIKAPSSGTINLSVAQGLQLSAGSSSDASNKRVATITSEGTPIITVGISEIDIANVKTNQKVNITFDSLSDMTFTGKVVAIDKLGTTTSDVVTYTALVQMDSASPKILSNMVANVYILTEVKTDVLMIPSGAINTSSDGRSVQTMKDGEVIWVQVEVGISNDTHTEIVSGLNAGDEVVTSTTAQSASSESSDSTTSPFSGIGRTQSSGTVIRSSGGGVPMGPGL